MTPAETRHFSGVLTKTRPQWGSMGIEARRPTEATVGFDPSSEHQLQSKLNLPWRGRQRGDQSGRGIDGSAGEYGSVGGAQVGMVEDIEELRSKLEAGPLRHRRVLDQR